MKNEITFFSMNACKIFIELQNVCLTVCVFVCLSLYALFLLYIHILFVKMNYKFDLILFAVAFPISSLDWILISTFRNLKALLFL